MLKKIFFSCCVFCCFALTESNAQFHDYSRYQKEIKDTVSPGMLQLLKKINRFTDSTLNYINHSVWKNSAVRPHYFIDNFPVYMGLKNEGSASTISTDKARQVYGLTGANMTLMQWDGGMVRENHILLNGAADNFVTNNIAHNDHATHVAGTMVSNGLLPGTMGMAPSAHLEAHRFTQDVSYLGEILTSSLSYQAGLISNHSYGERCGWEQDNSGKYFWTGNENHSTTEDSQFGLYSGVSYFLDNICYQADKHLLVVAASNDRNDRNKNPDGKVYTRGTNGVLVERTDIRPAPDYAAFLGFNTVVPVSSTKNTLVVGAVYEIPNGYNTPSQILSADFSNWGPTDDGRIKPDIVAKGVAVKSSVAFSQISGIQVPSLTNTEVLDGTSMATPSVTGSALLLAEKFIEQTSHFPKSSSLKGLIIHTADSKNINGAPDYKYGWGLMNTKHAADFLTTLETETWILERQLINNRFDTLTFQADGTKDIIATICWTDPPGNPVTNSFLNNRTSMLINDLDIRIFKQADLVYSSTLGFRPYVLDVYNPASGAILGDNAVDNVEKIYIPAAQITAGTYVLVVKHKGSLVNGLQNYSLLLSNVTNIIYQKPIITFKPIQHNYNEITWDDFSSLETSYRIERKIEGENAWYTRGVVPANTLLFRDSTIVPSRVHAYRIVAINQNQTISSTNEASALTPPAPRKATQLAVTLTNPSPVNRTLRLQWQDNADNETGFEISYSRDGFNFEILDTLLPLSGIDGTGSFYHAGLPENSSYFYRIKTFWNNFDSGYSATARYNLSLPVSTLDRVEYYFDTDPGFDAGYPVPGITGSLAAIIPSVAIPPSLTDGLHNFFIRAKTIRSGLPYWSNIYSAAFLKLTASSATPSVVLVEYYIDTDPGIGNGNPVDVSGITGNQYMVPVDLSAITTGLHHLYIRAKDNRGLWSNIYSTSFVRMPGAAGPPVITRLEYTVDDLNVLGSGTNVPVPGNAAINQPVAVDLSSTLPGLHTLYLRAMDNAGKWSNIYSSNFICLNGNGGTPAVKQTEYYFDSDPGWGNGTVFNFPANAPKVIQDFNAPLGSLTDGLHTLYIRAKDQNGNWSNIFNKLFLKLTGTGGERKIVELEYTIDNGLLIGNGTAVSLTAANKIDIVFTLPALTNGKHLLSIRAKDNTGLPGNIYADSFFVNDQQFCQLGSNVFFKSTVSNAAAYQWQEYDGANWSAITNTAYYSGTDEQTLRIAIPPTSWYGKKFRCVADGITGTEFILKFSNTWTGAVNNDWFTAGNWSCGVIPDEYTDVVIIQDVPRFPQLNATGTCRSLYMRSGAQLTVEAGQLLQIMGQ